MQAKLSYAELNRLSDRFAAALVQLGVAKGDRVSLMLPNMPQLVIAYFGVLKAGAIVVNTNPTYPAHELAPLLRNAGAETIVTLSGLYERVLEVQPDTALKTIILADIPDSIGRPFHNSVVKQVRAGGLMKDVTLQRRRLFHAAICWPRPRPRRPPCPSTRPTTRPCSSSPAAPQACPKRPS
ncbi:MAG: AMP-binding protein [Anaerolineae bacterium]